MYINMYTIFYIYIYTNILDFGRKPMDLQKTMPKMCISLHLVKRP